MLKLDGESSSVEEVDAIAANIISIDGGIAVLGAEGETVEVYSMLGTIVSKTVATDFVTSVKLHDGAYIVKVGNKTYRVIVR